MRLVKAVSRLEAAGAAREREAPARTGICWSRYDERVEPGALERGEYIAVDVRIESQIAGVDQVAVTERVTCDESDLGWVSDAGGKRMGRVRAIDGSLITWEEFEEEG